MWDAEDQTLVSHIQCKCPPHCSMALTSGFSFPGGKYPRLKAAGKDWESGTSMGVWGKDWVLGEGLEICGLGIQACASAKNRWV